MKKTTKMKKLIGLRSEAQNMNVADYDEGVEGPVLDKLAEAGAAGMLVTELGVACFYGAGCPGRRAKNLAQAKSWGRNALRRPLREGHMTTDGACTKRGRHEKGDGSWWEHDAQGIPLCRVCADCRAEKLSGYRPEIITGYNQGDVDEPIDPDPSAFPELDDLSSYGDA